MTQYVVFVENSQLSEIECCKELRNGIANKTGMHSRQYPLIVRRRKWDPCALLRLGSPVNTYTERNMLRECQPEKAYNLALNSQILPAYNYVCLYVPINIHVLRVRLAEIGDGV